MLDELKNLDVIGRRRDLLYFLQTAIGYQHLSRADVKTICAHAPGHFTLNYEALLLFCRYLDLIPSDICIELDETVLKLINNQDALAVFIIERCVAKAFENCVIREDFFSFDVEESKFAFKNEKLPLCWSFIRNLLIDFGFFSVERTARHTKIHVAPEYESVVKKYCKPKKKSMSIEQLRRQLEDSIVAGEQAEQFVLKYERQRVKNELLSNRVKIISDIDVCAGYDIVSFNSDNSIEYDRFIEVKAVSSDLNFFWSRNELETARLKNTNYYLYLIELSKININYHPIVICNPAVVLFDSEEWNLEPQTYKVKHINIDLM